MREWKKFIDHDKILEILKNINTEGETEDQKESKKNEDKEDDADNEKENTGKIDKANIIDIISNYFEEEFDLDEVEVDNSIRDMAALTIRAATDAGVYQQKEDGQYEFDKINEVDEEEEDEANISSGGPGNDTSAKRN